MIVPGPPVPKPISLISTTAAEYLRSCWMKLCFSQSANHRRLILKGTSSIIGTVSHKVIELAVKGTFGDCPVDDLDNAMKTAWEEEIKREIASTIDSPHKNYLSCPERWPYYQIQRARALKAARDEAIRYISRSNLQPSLRRLGSVVVQTERNFVGFEGRISGRIDRIDERSGQLVIVDYKTGKIAEDGTMHGEEIRPTYRRQLLMYAALYWDVTGVWPNAGELIGLRGETIVLVIDPAESLNYVNETLDRFHAYNHQVQDGTPLGATPSQENCLQCSYRGMCPDFWDAVSPSWHTSQSANVSGTIEGLRQGTTIKLRVVHGDRPSGDYQLSGITDDKCDDIVMMELGKQVRIVNARAAHDSTSPVLGLQETTEIWID